MPTDPAELHPALARGAPPSPENAPDGTPRWRRILSTGIPLGVVLAVIAYGLVWQRGFYMDDYSNRAAGYDVVARQPLPIWSADAIPGFPVRALAWALNRQLAVWLAGHEWAVRAACSLFAALNGLLLGVLAARLTGARVAGVAAGWIYLAPFVAQEAVLWAGAVSYTFNVTLALLGIMAMSRGAIAATRVGGVAWSAVGILLFLLCMLCFETPLTMTAFLPFAAIALAMRRSRCPSRAAIRALLSIAALVVLAGLYAWLFYGRAPMLESRGGFVRNVAEWFGRLRVFMEGLEWLTIGSYGARLTAEAFGLGLEKLLSTVGGLLTSAAFLVLALPTVAGWQPQRARLPRSRQIGLGVCMIAGGAALFFASYWVPATLVRGQIVEFRMLYMPLAGLCLGLAGLVSIATCLLPWAWLERALLAASCGVAAACALCMLGYCATFAARFQLDERQVGALLETVSADALPADACFAPLELDERLFRRDDALSRLLFGVFATPWSANARLREAYHRRDVQSTALNPWLGVRIEVVADGATPCGSDRLRFNGVEVCAERAIPFAYRDGRAWLVERVEIRSDGEPAHEVAFTSVASLAGRGAPAARAVVQISPDGSCLWKLVYPDSGSAARLDAPGRIQRSAAVEQG